MTASSKPRCEECERQRLRYKVYRTGLEALGPEGEDYWDEDGIYRKAPVYATQCYRCSNGHYWTEKRLVPGLWAFGPEAK